MNRTKKINCSIKKDLRRFINHLRSIYIFMYNLIFSFSSFSFACTAHIHARMHQVHGWINIDHYWPYLLIFDWLPGASDLASISMSFPHFLRVVIFIADGGADANDVVDDGRFVPFTWFSFALNILIMAHGRTNGAFVVWTSLEIAVCVSKSPSPFW